jgi:hypothetical protein
MKTTSLLRLMAVLTVSSLFALSTLAAADFSGTWVMNVSKSKNLGMMSSMQITLKIEQTQNSLKVIETTKFNGQDQVRELHYDLTGKSAANNGPMGDPNQTVTKVGRHHIGNHMGTGRRRGWYEKRWPGDSLAFRFREDHERPIRARK